MKNDKYALALKVLLILALVLRLALFWVTPPQLALDDHFEPIVRFLQTGELPDKFACWQCYQPPFFYAISALLGKLALAAGLAMPAFYKFLQFLNCLFDLVTVGVLYLIVKRLPVSGFARTLAFGTVALLPRHIYMGAWHGNDTLSYLAVALCVYLLMFVVEGRDRPLHLVLLSVAISAALFTKYTTFAVLPMVGVTLLLLAAPPRRLPWRTVAGKAAMVLLLPLLLFGGYMVHNQSRYGTPLPYNDRIYDPAVKQPRDPGGASFTTFKPWLFVASPYLKPGQVSSFWTLTYSSLWFDIEPKFLMFLDNDRYWWIGYYAWLKGDGPYPAQPHDDAQGYLHIGSALVALGLAPLFVGLTGLALFVRQFVRRDWQEFFRYQPFVVLLACNIVEIVMLVLKMPTYTTMKGSYLLASLPAFAALVALGAGFWERNRGVKLALSVLFSALFLMVVVHIAHMVATVNFRG